jgi:hypothetical protein
VLVVGFVDELADVDDVTVVVEVRDQENTVVEKTTGPYAPQVAFTK